MLISVAVPVPLLDLLTYSVPDTQDPPAIGARVIVPLGQRVVTGIVIAQGVGAPASGAVKPVQKVLDAGAFVPPEVVALARWTADYYVSGVGDAIPLLLPPMARGGRADAHKTRRIVSATPSGLDVLVVAAKDLTPRQTEALGVISGSPDGIPASELASRGISADILSRLARRGYINIRSERVERDPFRARPAADPRSDPGSDPASDMGSDPASDPGSDPVSDPGSDPGSDPRSDPRQVRRLTAEQVAAVERLQTLAKAGSFKVAVLHGVTGSGKTEIYLCLAQAVRGAGRRSLILVPEIALTPAAAAQFRAAFGDRVAIQHSGLSDGERHDQWQRIRRGDVDIVVGTRSAVFAPLERVGLIVVDEEHDASYKQDEAPRYNGRDVAIVRARHAGALVVLGSATPSMETYHNAMSGKYERVVLERRVLDRPLAAVTVVDMREEYAVEGDVILSRRLRDAIASRLAAAEQSLVLLNRRGFATAVFCRQCAGTLDCPNCSVSLVVHGGGNARRALCHYCNYTARVPTKCPLCAGPYLDHSGYGTERVEAELRKACPTARIARLDRDSIRRKGSLNDLLERFQRGSIDVLVGTQMIAKGHDFPRVTLVGVISADVGLGIADFRASERTFQLLTQVAGRAGRGERPGEAVIQTLYPEHYSVQLACRQDYRSFFNREIRFREAMRYPPIVSLINVIVRARTYTAAIDDATDVAQRIRQRTGDGRDIRILGPAPPPLGKLRGEFRAQLLLKSRNRRLLREAIRAVLAERCDLQRRIVVDVDPLSVL